MLLGRRKMLFAWSIVAAAATAVRGVGLVGELIPVTQRRRRKYRMFKGEKKKTTRMAATVAGGKGRGSLSLETVVQGT
jgi:hypothetical protein